MLCETVPGYTKHSAHFSITFVTGQQCGMNSSVIEWQTDWHDIMTIVLTGLETHPDHVTEAASVMAADLETWAQAQPGGAMLNLRISVAIAEGRYFLPPLGRRKELRIFFNDRFNTQVLFHIAKKRVEMESLRRLATLAVANQLRIPAAPCADAATVDAASVGSLELPRCLAAEVRTALHFSWTARQYWRGVGRCRAWCPCRRPCGGGGVPQGDDPSFADEEDTVSEEEPVYCGQEKEASDSHPQMSNPESNSVKSKVTAASSKRRRSGRSTRQPAGRQKDNKYMLRSRK
jgi:hypothetical protein